MRCRLGVSDTAGVTGYTTGLASAMAQVFDVAEAAEERNRLASAMA